MGRQTQQLNTTMVNIQEHVKNSNFQQSVRRRLYKVVDCNID